MDFAGRFEQNFPDNNQQNAAKPILIQPKPQTSSHQISEPVRSEATNSKLQSSYQVKCSLLDYHIQEAVLVNKALKSEVKQYREKIEFEKRLRKFLVSRVKAIES